MVTYGTCEQLERASHIAHSVACHLRLLATAACAQRGPSFQLCAHSFAAGMHGLSDAVRELQDQLDELPISSHHEASHELAQCSRIATRVASGWQRAERSSSLAILRHRCNRQRSWTELQHKPSPY